MAEHTKIELKPGDIIVFKTEQESWISRAIAYLTDSDTSHAAMMYTKDSIVELISSGICVNKVALQKGEEAYVMRLNPPVSAEPLLKKAGQYLAEKNKYDFSGLFILAGIMLFRKIRPSGKFFAVADKILLAAGLELDRFLQKIAGDKNKRAMVCSQFVYQLYYDCGDKYRIRIRNGSAMLENGAFSSDDSVRLFDLAMAVDENGNDAAADNLEEPEDEEQLSRELYEALQEIKEMPMMQGNLLEAGSGKTAFDTNTQLQVSKSARAFITKLEKLHKELNLKIPLDSMFVTPGDFVDHAENLKKIGIIELNRIN